MRVVLLIHPSKVNLMLSAAIARLLNSKDLMADLSKLSIAPNYPNLRQQHQSMLSPQLKSNRAVTPDITSEFCTAASGLCDLLERLKTQYSPDARQLSILVNWSKMNISLSSKQ